MPDERASLIIEFLETECAEKEEAIQVALEELDGHFGWFKYVQHTAGKPSPSVERKHLENLAASTSKLIVTLRAFPEQDGNVIADDAIAHFSIDHPELRLFLAPGYKTEFFVDLLKWLRRSSMKQLEALVPFEPKANPPTKRATPGLDDLCIGACTVWCQILQREYSMTWDESDPDRVSPMILFAHTVVSALTQSTGKTYSLRSIRQRLSKQPVQQELQTFKPVRGQK
tara:strand:+ start:2611 stop:3294 length:684 start_codon:yes stop_codon:yes gene_type:complete